MLYLIGLGLYDTQDLTLKGLRCVNECETVYLEGYTSLLGCSLAKLEEVCGKKVIVLQRPDVESDFLLSEASQKKVALLVMGDPFAATTHSSLVLEALGRGIPVEVVHNASILSAVGETGLSLYKFGRVISLVFYGLPDSVYDAVRENQKAGLHTLCLLDIQSEHKRFMSIQEGIQKLLALEEKRKESVLSPLATAFGIARIGSEEQLIKAGRLKELEQHDFGKPPHCLVLPAKHLHFIEESWISYWRKGA